MRKIAHRCGKHAQILLGDTCQAFQPKRIRGGNNAFSVKQRPVDVKELASCHLTIVGNRSQRVDVFMNDIDELLQLVIGLRFANETFRKFLKRIFFAEVRRKEQHQAQTTVDFTTRLECGILLRTPLALLCIVVSAVAVDFHGCDSGAIASCGFVGRHELRGGIQTAVERVDSLLRTDDGSTRMRKHEHGQIIGIGVGDVQMLAVNIYSRRETTLVNDLDQFVGNGLRSQTRSDGIKTKPWSRSLRDTRRGTGRMLRLMCGS